MTASVYFRALRSQVRRDSSLRAGRHVFATIHTGSEHPPVPTSRTLNGANSIYISRNTKCSPKSESRPQTPDRRVPEFPQMWTGFYEHDDVRGSTRIYLDFSYQLKSSRKDRSWRSALASLVVISIIQKPTNVNTFSRRLT